LKIWKGKNSIDAIFILLSMENKVKKTNLFVKKKIKKKKSKEWVKEDKTKKN
jgi:hypothetical protein